MNKEDIKTDTVLFSCHMCTAVCQKDYFCIFNCCM